VSIVHIPGLTYSFVCRFRGKKPENKVQELPGDAEETLAHTEVAGKSSDGWNEVKCELARLRAGAWQVRFTVSELCVLVQTIVAGPVEKLEPTAEESIALGIPLPLPPSRVAKPIRGASSRDLPPKHRSIVSPRIHGSHS
jgi:hypothetical protein